MKVEVEIYKNGKKKGLDYIEVNNETYQWIKDKVEKIAIEVDDILFNTIVHFKFKDGECSSMFSAREMSLDEVVRKFREKDN